jgi:hypothetical protein
MVDISGPQTRINRANRKISDLRVSFREFFSANDYEIGVAEYNRKADSRSLRVVGGPDGFPSDWSLRIGEIAHNLRAALDGLTWQLALITKGDPYKNTAFPIVLEKTKWKTVSNNLLQDVPRKPVNFRQMIESFQPYNGKRLRRRSPLYRLEELNNTDKHRLVTILNTVPAGIAFSGLSGESRFYHNRPLAVNAKVGWVRDPPPNRPGGGGVYLLNPATGKLVEPTLYVESIDIHPAVVFGDSCKAVRRLDVIRTLHAMADEVSRVVNAFDFK